MGVRFHRKVKVSKKDSINVSKTGVSYSKKVGDLTFNSRRGVTLKSPIKGLSFNSSSSPYIIIILFLIQLFWWFFKLPFFVIYKIIYWTFKLIYKGIIRLIDKKTPN